MANVSILMTKRTGWQTRVCGRWPKARAASSGLGLGGVVFSVSPMVILYSSGRDKVWQAKSCGQLRLRAMVRVLDAGTYLVSSEGRTQRSRRSSDRRLPFRSHRVALTVSAPEAA